MATRKEAPPTSLFQESSSPTSLFQESSWPTPMKDSKKMSSWLLSSPTSVSKATTPPTPLRIDPSIWGKTDSNNQNLPRQQQRNGNNDSHEQDHIVLANNGGDETGYGPLVFGAAYKPPGPPHLPFAPQAWPEHNIPAKFRRHRPETKTDLNIVPKYQPEISNMSPSPYSSLQNVTSSASSTSATSPSARGHSTSSFMSQPQFGPSEYQAQHERAAYPPAYLTMHLQQAGRSVYVPNHRPQSIYSGPPSSYAQSSEASWNGPRTSRARGGMRSGGGRGTGAVVRSYGPTNHHTTSANYKGNPDVEANQSHDIPESESCSLWITDLPPRCDVRMLLSQVVNCDKVFATVISPPLPDQGKPYAAAKIVFWSRQGVDRLRQRAKEGRFFPHVSPLPKVYMNRVRTKAAKPNWNVCRVLLIKGHRSIANEEYLRTKLFLDKFTWQDDGPPRVVREYPETHIRILEWRFGSWRCQAENAYGILMNKIYEGNVAAERAERRRGLEQQERALEAEIEFVNENFLPFIVENNMKIVNKLEDLHQKLDEVRNRVRGLPETSDDEVLWKDAVVIFGVDPCA